MCEELKNEDQLELSLNNNDQLDLLLDVTDEIVSTTYFLEQHGWIA